MNKVLFSSASEEWETPNELFMEFNKEFHFTIDVASSEENHKCNRYFTKEQDGLRQNWDYENVWCNPPYGRQITQWFKKLL